MARPTLARRLGAAVLLTALLGTTAACGGDTAADDDSSASAADGSGDSGDSADSADSADSGDLEELSADEFYPAVMAAMEEAETMRFSITSSGTGNQGSEITGSMRYTDDGQEMQATGTGAQPMEMVMVDKVLYISGAGMPLPEGKKWLKVDLSDPNSLFGQLGKATDPEFMFKAMQTPKEFTLVGEEDVDGEPTNHYHVVMDTAAYVKAMDMPAEMSSMMPDELAMDMWLDAEDRPRKFAQELEIPSPTKGGEPVRTSTEGTYSDFGEDVTIEAPPAGEVADKVPGLS